MQVLPIEFRASDGRSLRGQVYGEGERWAVLVHEEGLDLDAWRDLPPRLHDLGLCVLAFDLRGHGASDDPWDADRLPGDVLAALEFARSQGATKLYLVGAGAGADACLQAAVSEPVEALVAISPQGHLDDGAVDSLREVNVPRLILVGSSGPAALATAERLYRASTGWCLLVALPSEEQGSRLLAGDPGDPAREKVLGFLRDYL
jgi:pimeloyl-ACP methyl ester carboxylesterase